MHISQSMSGVEKVNRLTGRSEMTHCRTQERRVKKKNIAQPPFAQLLLSAPTTLRTQPSRTLCCMSAEAQSATQESSLCAVVEVLDSSCPVCSAVTKARKATRHPYCELSVDDNFLFRYSELESELRQDRREASLHFHQCQASAETFSRPRIEHGIGVVVGRGVLQPTLGSKDVGVHSPGTWVAVHAIDVVHHDGAPRYPSAVGKSVVVHGALEVDGDGKI